MTKDKDTKTVVPVLRFPEFQKTEGWHRETIGNLYVFKQTNSFSRDSLNYTAGLVKNIHYGDIHTKFSLLFDVTKEEIPYINPDIEIDRFKSDCFCQVSDIVFADASEDLAGIGKCIEIVNLNNEYVLSGLHTILARQKGSNFVTGFAGYLFMSEVVKAQINKESQGAKVLGISSKRLSNIILPFPKSKKEQAKIASCLSSLEDLISAVEDKIEALKEYKKGLMQQLFPAEGKTIPTIRLPEFQNTGEWKETTLGEEVYYENGKAHENDIDEAGQYIVVNSKFISTDGKVVKCTDNPCCLAEEGDILMVLSDVPNGRAIAKCFIVDCSGKYTVNQRICKLKPKKAVGLLLYYIINRNPFLLAFDDGIKQTNLKKDDVLNCPFSLPKSSKEQQWVANCLSSVDELIFAETDRLDQLNNHKKGLMQELFPTLIK